MVTAQQARTVGLQAGLVPLQTGPLTTVTATQIDIGSITNLMLVMMVMVMMVKAMGGITGIAGTAKETVKGLWK